jgi:CHAT domain
MDDQFAYQDFDLLVEPGPRGRYRARVLRSPAGESTAVQFTAPFSAMELENLRLRVGRGRRGTRGRGRPQIAPLKDFGGKLYDTVFQGELRDMLLRSLSLTSAPGAGLRLRLRLANAPDLAELPWEFLYDRRLNRFLAQSRRSPLVRYLDLPDPPRPLTVDGPLRLLVMISNPRDWPRLDVEQEWSVLTGALAQPQADGRVVIERMTANMSTLRQRLRREAFHVFHFIGHGQYRADWGDGVLVMEDAEGGPHEVTGEELGSLLNESDATRLAVLNACEGALTDASDPFAGMAQSLIQQGLPAVVAMQFEITDDAAIIFARELYGATADGYPVEAALAEARGAIRDEGNATEWGTPVLYSRAPDGHLFGLTSRGRTSEGARNQADAAPTAPVPPPRHTAHTERSEDWEGTSSPEPADSRVRDKPDRLMLKDREAFDHLPASGAARRSGDTPADVSTLYFDSTEDSRSSLDPRQPLLDKFVEFARAIAWTLESQFRFLDEDSEPANPARIRDHMMQEMNDLWHTRQGLLADLRQYFTDQNVKWSLSALEVGPQLLDSCLDELYSIRAAVKILGQNVRAAWDDLSNDNVTTAQRQESRAAALGSLQSLAQKWETLSEELLVAKNIAHQQDSA